MKKILAHVLCFLLTGCGAGVGDYETHLVNGYYFVNTGGNGHSIQYEGKIKKEWSVVNSKVINYVFNSRYIAVLRQPMKSRDEIMNDQSLRVAVADEYLERTLKKECEYWLINVTSHEIKGPLNNKEFVEKVANLELDLDKLKRPIVSKRSYCLPNYFP